MLVSSRSANKALVVLLLHINASMEQNRPWPPDPLERAKMAGNRWIEGFPEMDTEFWEQEIPSLQRGNASQFTREKM